MFTQCKNIKTQCKNIKIVNKLIHNVVTLCPQVTLTVDGQHKERWSAPAPFPLLSSSQVNWMQIFFHLLNIFARCGWAAPLRTCTRGQQPGRGRGACSGTTSTETSRQTSWAASRRWVAETRAVNELSRRFITATFQVSFTADSIHLPILELAKQGHALIR